MSSSLLESKTMFKLIAQARVGCVASRATPKRNAQMQAAQPTRSRGAATVDSLVDPGKVESQMRRVALQNRAQECLQRGALCHKDGG